MTLGRESWNVLRQDKELAAVPVVSAVACSVVAVAFGGAVYTTLTIVSDPVPGQDAMQASPVSYAVGVVGLAFVGIVAQFFTGVLIAQGGLGLLGVLVILPGVVVFGAVTAAGLPIVSLPLLFIYVAVASAILSALTGIFRAALYRYAVGLPNTGAFSDAQLAGAFKVK